VYYDLLQHRTVEKISDVALIRLEQLYPFPHQQVEKILKKYSKADDIIWLQEEPDNMGAWGYLLRTVSPLLKKVELQCIARPESASPATGSKKAHELQQKEIIEKVFGK